MTQDQANVIQTLTNAMTAADQMNNQVLVRQLQKQIDVLLADQAEPVKASATIASGAAYAPVTDEDKFIAFIGDRCPCCIMTEFVTTGKEIGMDTEQFIYMVGKTAGYNELAGIMQSSATKIKEDLCAMPEDDEQYKLSAVRFADFTNAGIKARERLSAEGLAPQIDIGMTILGAVLEAKANELRRRLGE